MSSVGDQSSHLPRGLPLPPTSSKDTRPNDALIREASAPSGLDPTRSTRAGAAPPRPNLQSRNCVSRGPASSDKTVVTTSIQKSKFPSSPPPSPPTSPRRSSLLRQPQETTTPLRENSFTYVATSAQSRSNIPSGPAEQSNPRAALKEADKLGTFAKITRTVSEFFKPPQKDLQRQNSAPGEVETGKFQKSSITVTVNEPITISEFFNQNSLKNEQKALEMIVKTLDSTIDKGGQTYKPIELSYEGVKGSLIEFGAAIASVADAVLQSKDLSIHEKQQLLEQLPNLNIDIKGSDGRSAQMTINTAYEMLSRKFEENLSTRLKQLSTEVATLRSEDKNKQADELILQMKSIKTSKLTSDANPSNITQFKLKENEITSVVNNIPQPSLDEIKGELENVLLENRNFTQFFNSIGINTPQAQEHLVGLLYKGQDELTDFVSELKKQILSQNINSEMLKEKLNLQNLMRNNSFAEGMFDQSFAGPSSSTVRPAPQPIASSSTQNAGPSTSSSSPQIQRKPSRLRSLFSKSKTTQSTPTSSSSIAGPSTSRPKKSSIDPKLLMTNNDEIISLYKDNQNFRQLNQKIASLPKDYSFFLNDGILTNKQGMNNDKINSKLAVELILHYLGDDGGVNITFRRISSLNENKWFKATLAKYPELNDKYKNALSIEKNNARIKDTKTLEDFFVQISQGLISEAEIEQKRKIYLTYDIPDYLKAKLKKDTINEIRLQGVQKREQDFIELKALITKRLFALQAISINLGQYNFSGRFINDRDNNGNPKLDENGDLVKIDVILAARQKFETLLNELSTIDNDNDLGKFNTRIGSFKDNIFLPQIRDNLIKSIESSPIDKSEIDNTVGQLKELFKKYCSEDKDDFIGDDLNAYLQFTNNLSTIIGGKLEFFTQSAGQSVPTSSSGSNSNSSEP